MNPPLNSNFAIKMSSLLQENLVKIQQPNQKLMVDMSRATSWCRLCINNCRDYKNLYDENGHRNVELYEMSVKYFHPVFLTISKCKKLTVICLECWRKIYEFHSFQNEIILAQAELLDKQVEPVVVNTEEASPSEQIAGNLIPGNERHLESCDNDTDNKDGIIRLHDLEVGEEAEHDVSSVTGIIGSVDGRSSMTESESITRSPVKTRALTREISNVHSFENRQNIASDDEFMGDGENDNMEFSQSDLALIDSMEIKTHDIDPLSLRANKTNKNGNGAETEMNKDFTHQSTQKSREFQRKRLDDLIAQWGQSLDCPVCKESLVNYSTLRAHFEKEHRHNEFYIMCCQRKFKTRFHIEEHIGLHLNPIGYECDICNATFTAKGALKRHKLHQHFMPKVKKPSCSKKKQYVKSVKDLDAVIARWKPNLQCVFCNASHPNFEVLRRHFHLEHPTEQCYITCCQQKLETRWRIMEHARFHMDPKSFRCKYCDKRQTSRKLLREHMYQDHSILVGGNNKEHVKRDHKCTTCDKVFRSLNNLKAHMDTHAQEDLSSQHTVDHLTQDNEEPVGVSLPGGGLNEDVDSFQLDTTLIDSKEFNSHPDQISLSKMTRKLNEDNMYQDDKKDYAKPNLKCTNCDRVFKSLNNLKAHMVTHSLEAHSSQYITDKLCREHEEPVGISLPGGVLNNPNEDMDSFQSDTTLIDSKQFYSHPNQILQQMENKKPNPDPWLVETREAKMKRLDDLIIQWGQCLYCPICQESFTNYSTLREHFEKQHSQNSFYIICCQHKLNTRFHIEEHIRLHLDPTVFKCEVCGTTFSARSSFKRHMLHQHGNSKKANKRQTQRAKETTPKRKQYNKSVKELDAIIHRWKPELLCELCHASQPCFEVMRRHFRLEHTHEKCYIVCCQRKLETRVQIAEHARFHTDPKKYKCKFCNERHVSRRQLLEHMYEEHSIQGGERKVTAICNLKCSVCDKVFMSTEELQAHMVSHAGMDLYKCLYCPDTMRYRYNLYPHLKNVHSKEWTDTKNVQKHFEMIKIQEDGSVIPHNTCQ